MLAKVGHLWDSQCDPKLGGGILGKNMEKSGYVLQSWPRVLGPVLGTELLQDLRNVSQNSRCLHVPLSLKRKFT